MPKKARLCVLLVVSLLLLSAPLKSQGGYPRRPKLVLVIAIDQFRFDYLMRFRPQFVSDGFNLLLNGGANFVDCRYDYATTVTGSGHATLLTGAYANLHGIIENQWYDRTLHREVGCVEDSGTEVVSGDKALQGSAGASPHNLIGSTLGDELRVEDNFQSKVVSISLKDRSAVLPGGHTANAAYWYDAMSGHFVSSTYYMANLPPWAVRFNEQEPSKPYCGKSWQALPETPGASGMVFQQALPSGGPCPNPNFLSWLMNAPYMTEIQLNFSRAAVEGEQLGQGEATDLLAISISFNDFVGHAFGPYSPQVADTVLRTDRYLADFFRDLDKSIGMKNVWIALTADHGVAPNPTFIREHHLGMGQIPGFQLNPAANRAKPRTMYTAPVAPLETPVAKAVESALSKAFRQDHWVEFADGFYVYLDLATLAKHHVDRAKAESVAAEAALTVPGVEAVFTRTQFLTGTLPDTPLARKAARSFNPQRSGDIFLVASPYTVVADSDVSTTHGTPWSYDAQVPLVFWGSAFKPGVYTTPCQPIDLAATLAVALGLTQPSGSQGQPLSDAIKP